MSRRVPGDACPYTRPFPDGFDSCPAFSSVPYVGVDLSYRPMPPGVTCAHLVTAAIEPEARFYARCAIGDAAARRRWDDDRPGRRMRAVPLAPAQAAAVRPPDAA